MRHKAYRFGRWVVLWVRCSKFLRDVHKVTFNVYVCRAVNKGYYFSTTVRCKRPNLAMTKKVFGYSKDLPF